jgi:acetylserotonin N-methyltransferase
MQQEGLPDAAPVLDLLNGFRRSKTLFTLCSLGVPDVLAGGQQLNLQQLCAAITAHQGGIHPSTDGLGRLLDAAVSIQLLAGNREGYKLTPLAEAYLVTSSPYSLTGYVHHSDKVLYKLWGGLETSVMTGRNCWDDAFGLDSKDVFAR